MEWHKTRIFKTLAWACGDIAVAVEYLLSEKGLIADIGLHWQAGLPILAAIAFVCTGMVIGLNLWVLRIFTETGRFRNIYDDIVEAHNAIVRSKSHRTLTGSGKEAVFSLIYKLDEFGIPYPDVADPASWKDWLPVLSAQAKNWALDDARKSYEKMKDRSND